MSGCTSEAQARYAPTHAEDWRERYDVGQWRRPSGWLLTGLVLAGLGALAWYYLGPDLRRYMKIKSM